VKQSVVCVGTLHKLGKLFPNAMIAFHISYHLS